MSFWDIIWFIFVTYLFFAYLMIMFRIVVDLFRDPDAGGFTKAVWLVALIVVPVFSALAYIITRGRGMTERAAAEVHTARVRQDAYIKEVAGTPHSAADQIAQGQKLLDSGAISEQEYASLKAKALA
jgi:hypothetical protein